MRNSRFPLWAFVVTGYLSIGRPFAYLGVPPLFIGEAYLGWNIFRNRHNWLGQFVDDFLRRDPVSLAVGLNLLWGVVEVFRCLYLGRPPLEIFRVFALNYYPLYLLAGIAIGRDWSAREFVRVWKIALMIFGPYASVAILLGGVGPGGFDMGVASLAPIVPPTVMALWPYLRTWKLRHIAFMASAYPTVFVNGTGRGFLLGLLAGLAMVMISSGMQIKRIITSVTVILLVLVIVGPFIETSGGAHPLDPVVFAAKLVAAFDNNTAAKILEQRGYRQEAQIIEAAAGTARWRQMIWRGAIHSLNSTTLWVMGQGGGASMAEYVPQHAEIHTPHNFTIFCLYYFGVVGLAAYLNLLAAIVLAARKIQDLAFRSMVQGIVAAAIMVALTSDCFETPFGAVPFFLLCGVTLGVGQSIAPKPKRDGAARFSGVSHRLEQPASALA